MNSVYFADIPSFIALKWQCGRIYAFFMHIFYNKIYKILVYM